MVKKGRTPSSAKKEEIAAVENDAPVENEAPVENDAPVEEVEAPEDGEAAEAEAPVEEPAVIDAPVNKKKKAAAAAVAEENGVAEDAPVVNGDVAPAADEAGEKKAEEKEEKKKTPKPAKRVVPTWASISDEARKNLSKSKLPKPKTLDAIMAAMSACADPKGLVSAGAIRKFVMEDNPDLSSLVLKKTVLKAVERGLIKQVKGNGFTGSFKLESAKTVAKAAKASKTSKGGKVAKSSGPKMPPLENEFPNIFTWACNPKEASVPYIRKYLVKHYPELNVEENPKGFKKALEGGEKKGQLKRITGQGFSGTFALVDGADKTGANFEDAFENAIIAMSEPKQVSVNSLRDYLGEYHKEYNTDNRPKVVKNALERAVAKGWLKQISGRGPFSGTYRLMHPYFPAPKELWGELFVEKKEKEEKAEKSTPKRKATKRAAVESESEEESEDEDNDDGGEVMPSPKKRGAPTPRKTAAPVKKVAKKVVAKKSKPAPKKGKKGKK